jgi:hypothetical protein
MPPPNRLPCLHFRERTSAPDLGYGKSLLPIFKFKYVISQRVEVTGDWRKLHNEELHNLYSSPDIIRQVKANEVGGACGTHGRGEKSVQGFGGKA